MINTNHCSNKVLPFEVCAFYALGLSTKHNAASSSLFLAPLFLSTRHNMSAGLNDFLLVSEAIES